MLIPLGMHSNFATLNENAHQTGNASIEFTQVVGNTTESFLFKYDNFNDLETFDFGLLNDIFGSDDQDCEVTATVTVSATFSIGGNVGVASSAQQSTITVSAEVTASCGEIDNAVKNVIAKLRRIIGF